MELKTGANAGTEDPDYLRSKKVILFRLSLLILNVAVMSRSGYRTGQTALKRSNEILVSQKREAVMFLHPAGGEKIKTTSEFAGI